LARTLMRITFSLRILAFLLAFIAVDLAAAPIPGRYLGTLKQTTELPDASISQADPVQKITARVTAEGRIFIIAPAMYTSAGALGSDGAFDINFGGLGRVTGTATILRNTIKMTFSKPLVGYDEAGATHTVNRTVTILLVRSSQ